MNIYSNFDHILTNIEKGIAGFCLGACTFIIFTSVISRYIFGYNYAGMEELSRYLMIWTVFIASSLAIRNGNHIKVDIIINILSPRKRYAVQVFSSLLGAAFCLFLFIKGVEITVDSYIYKEVSRSSMRFPMFLSRMAIPMGALFMLIRFMQRAFHFLAYIYKI